jgi:hypothetical protein
MVFLLPVTQEKTIPLTRLHKMQRLHYFSTNLAVYVTSPFCRVATGLRNLQLWNSINSYYNTF